MTNPQHISELTKVCMSALRARFDAEPDDEKAREIIATAEKCGLHDLAADMVSDMEVGKLNKEAERENEVEQQRIISQRTKFCFPLPYPYRP